jgi:hypothetical protein
VAGLRLAHVLHFLELRAPGRRSDHLPAGTALSDTETTGVRATPPADLVALIEGMGLKKPQSSATAIWRRVGAVAEAKGWPVPSYGRVYANLACLSCFSCRIGFQRRSRNLARRVGKVRDATASTLAIMQAWADQH